MRAKDQTYLARLGFQDADKKNELHDMACYYLMQEAKTSKLAETFVHSRHKIDADIVEDKLGSIKSCSNLGGPYYGGREIELPRSLVSDVIGDEWHSSHHEMGISYRETQSPTSCKIKAKKLSSPIIKGNDKYRTVVGYADVLIRAEVTNNITFEALSFTIKNKYSKKPPRTVDDISLLKQASTKEVVSNVEHIFIEVKAGKTSLANIIQQMNIYREYFDNYGHVVYVIATLYPLSDLEKSILDNEGYKYIYIKPDDVRTFMS